MVRERQRGSPESHDGIAFVFVNGALVPFDSVRIVPAGTVADAVGNKAQSNNQWVGIKEKAVDVPTWKLGWIKDKQGDGYGDSIQYTIIVIFI